MGKREYFNQVILRRQEEWERKMQDVTVHRGTILFYMIYYIK
jgi:hypothetical protein